MKKMIEVFNGKPCGFSTRMTDEQVRAGQHCINHSDALADALSDLLHEINNGGSIRYPVEIAMQALASYRGEV